MNDKTTLKIPKYNLNLKINNNKNIVQAALEAGVKLSFSCRSGVCGTCKAKIINGETDNSKGITHNLTNEEKSNNIITQGFTDNYIKVHIEENISIQNTIVSVLLKKNNGSYMEGEII